MVLLWFAYLQNMRGIGPIQLLYVADEDAGNRKLKEIHAEPDNKKKEEALVKYYYDVISNPEAKEEFREIAKRSLQNAPERQIAVTTFDSCVFEFNSYGTENAATTHHGVINAESASNRLIVKNSVFHSNEFGDEGITVRYLSLPYFLSLLTSPFLNNLHSL